MELTQAMPLGHIEACRKQGNLSIHIYPMVIKQKQWEAPASVCKASIAYSTGRFFIAISNSEFTFRDCIGQYSIFMIDWHTLLAQTSQKHPDHQQTIWLLPFNSACPVNKHTKNPEHLLKSSGEHYRNMDALFNLVVSIEVSWVCHLCRSALPTRLFLPHQHANPLKTNMDNGS